MTSIRNLSFLFATLSLFACTSSSMPDGGTADAGPDLSTVITFDAGPDTGPQDFGTDAGSSDPPSDSHGCQLVPSQ